MKVRVGVIRDLDVVSVDMARFLVGRELGVPSSEVQVITWQAPAAGGCPLTKSEMRAVELLGQGLTFKQMAQMLGVSHTTVRTHLHNVYGKLGVPDRAQAWIECVKRGWIEVEVADTFPFTEQQPSTEAAA